MTTRLSAGGVAFNEVSDWKWGGLYRGKGNYQMEMQSMLQEELWNFLLLLRVVLT